MPPQIIPRDEHPISRKNIHPDALKVMYRLMRKGFTAYLVGGGVRDLILGRTPKDFDVGTNATPNQIKKAFRNCFIIGRRFRLAHIRFGDQIIETSTFRRCPEPDINSDGDLYVFRDNCYGTPEDDALRRDFTINALFYEVESFSVIDHVGGLSDIHNRTIRCIGDPNIRFREDPVRMIRAVRFASRLGFQIEPATFNAILRHHQDILKAAPARVFEELIKLFAYGSGEKAMRLLHKTGLLGSLLPEVADFLGHDHDQNQASPLWSWLRHLDDRIRATDSLNPILIFATLFFAPMHRYLAGQTSADVTEKSPSLYLRLTELLTPICIRISMPKLMTMRMIQVMANQSRFVPDKRKRFSKRGFVAQETFPETLALYEIGLRVAGEDLQSIEPWSALRRDVETQRPHSQTNERVANKRSAKKGNRQVKAGSKIPTGNADTTSMNGTPDAVAQAEEVRRPRPPRKRSRRRKPPALSQA
ncbi:polynucleotide adenylyltransferase PcnB [Desulfonatronum thioautotrophicum]|uniref:polynucleotide adenylyltransferase PcnB n=1 Tax=Desulfonatronum thioautotrophicum TaxID=617001 RepID=UPI000699BDA6|nr:polynucleotide adenylyltransferase PcnB [Desulfonatronum thioautotrophicum]